MSAPIVCAECGIRYGDHLDACPWCGRAQTAAPSPPQPVDAGRQPQAEPRPSPVRTVAPPTAAPPPPAGPSTNGVARAAPRAAEQRPVPVPPDGTSARAGQPSPAPAATQANLLSDSAATEPATRMWDPMRLKRAGVWAAAAIGCLVLGALLAEYAPLGLLAGGDDPTPLQPQVIVTPVDTPDAAPPADEGAPPTTAPATTSTVAPPTSAARPAIEPIGEPIALADLTLGVDGIGELEIGSDAATVLGRLAATFGVPDEDRARVSDGTFSGCPGEAVRIVRWGTLAVTTIPGSEGEVFAGYRVDLGFADGAAGPALETISGLRAGDTVADLQRVYAGLDLQFFEALEGAVFELRRPSDGTLLLTGPLTGVDPASEVRGIYSPDLCV